MSTGQNFDKEQSKIAEVSVLLDALEKGKDGDNEENVNDKIVSALRLKLQQIELEKNDIEHSMRSNTHIKELELEILSRNERLKLYASTATTFFAIAATAAAVILSRDNGEIKGALLFVVGAAIPYIMAIIFKRHF